MKLIVLLFILFISVANLYSNPLSIKDLEGDQRSKDSSSNIEGILKINLPESFLRKELEKALVKKDQKKESFIKEIHEFELDPMQNILIISGTAILPADIVYNSSKKTSDKSLSIEHSFRLGLRFPSAKKLALTRYFSLEIIEFKIEGQNYLSAVNRLQQYVVALILNTSLLDYILKKSGTSSVSNLNLSQRIKELFETQAIRFRNRTFSFKLDLSKIDVLKTYSGLVGLRFWNIDPIILKGNEEPALQVEAGLGKPSNEYFKLLREREAIEEAELEKRRSALYKQFGDIKTVIRDLHKYIEDVKSQYNFPLWEERQERFIRMLKDKVSSRIRYGLSLENPLFKANPKEQFNNIFDDTQSFIVNQLKELKISILSLEIMKKGGEEGETRPFLTKRISQKTISQSLRYARDFKFLNDQLFPELEVILAPHIPGVVLRGVMNMDFNALMQMGLSKEEVTWSATPLRIAGDIWGKGIPFEVALRIHAFDEGELGIDVKSFSLFSGTDRFSLSKESGHGYLITNWTKMAIVESLATLAFEDPARAEESTQGDQNDDENDNESYYETLDKISEQKKRYQKELSRLRRSDLSNIVNLAKIDIENNPFNTVGAEDTARRLRYFFQDIVKYDDVTEMVIFKLDPRIVSQTILRSKNSIQVWNVETIYDRSLNQTYLETSLGDGKRTKSYLKKIFSREEYTDSQNFVGIDESKNQSDSDLIFSVDLKDFEAYVNRLFMEATLVQSKEVEKALSRQEEQNHYLINDINIKAISDGKLGVNLTLSLVSKKKKGFLGRVFSKNDWKIKRKIIMVSSQLSLSVEKLSKYLNNIKKVKNDVFFGDELLRIDIEHAGLNVKGDTSILDRIINLFGADMNFKGGLSQKVKRILLHFLDRYFNGSHKRGNSNAIVGGVRLNRFIKLMTHKEEILIQINPHLSGNAFDLRLLSNGLFNNTEQGLIVNSDKNEIGFHLSTSGNLATVDKGELLRIMVETKELFSPFLKGEESMFLESSEVIKLYDKVFLNSDYTKLSLYHRYMRVMKNYGGVLNIIKPDTSVVDQINQSLETQFGVTSGEFNNRKLTSSGVEIIYFLSTAGLLRSQLELFIERARKFNNPRNVKFLKAFMDKEKEINERIIEPLVKVYKEQFLKRNKKITRMGVTDWNHSYYPDALFCEGVFQFMKSWRKENEKF